jgi:twitching motility protein PilT
VITIEDPIEFVHTNKRALVNQREVGLHTHSFSAALRAALREDPDVILVGELRDPETIAIGLTAAETGHLVLGTVHTTNASKTIDRLIDSFAGDQQGQVRSMLAESLRAVVAQKLLPRRDGKGRVMAFEILLNTSPVSSLIRDGKTFQIPGVMQTGRKAGMVLMDQSIADLVASGTVGAEEAVVHLQDKAFFQTSIRTSSEFSIGGR